MDAIQITVKLKQENKILYVNENESLSDCFVRNGLYVPAICGGRGICGKCRIRVHEGDIAVSDADAKFFSKEELDQGFRLACKAYPKEACTIELVNIENNFYVVSEYTSEKESGAVSVIEDVEFIIAVDLGTTTIAMQLVGFETKKVYATYTALNRQREYGADVLSRINAANSGKKEQLQKAVFEGLEKGISELGKEIKVIREIVIAGNTTMLHLLLGYSCEKLGVYPFEAQNLDRIQTTYKEIFHMIDTAFNSRGYQSMENVPVVILPGISAFVGADVTAGLLNCGFNLTDKVAAFIDLGTNGEMAVGNKNRILVTSAAAGPAFEGGNISNGIGSVAGAICHAMITDGEMHLETIGNEAPVGICGTGVVDVVYELLTNGIIDETGLIEDEYFELGYPIISSISITQKDIRELQLAKAAIRAGFETLLNSYGITYENLDKIYVAGGFGYKLDIKKAVGIGLFPKECLSKIETVGNSSLAGAIQYVTQRERMKEIDEFMRGISVIQLADSDFFHEKYLENMNF